MKRILALCMFSLCACEKKCGSIVNVYDGGFHDWVTVVRFVDLSTEIKWGALGAIGDSICVERGW